MTLKRCFQNVTLASGLIAGAVGIGGMAVACHDGVFADARTNGQRDEARTALIGLAAGLAGLAQVPDAITKLKAKGP